MARGENVLPCSFSPEQHAQDMEVTWFWEQFSPFVHRYKGDQDQYGEQMLQHQGRTELLKDSLAQGSTHLKLFHLQLSDRGNYTCLVQHGSDYDEAVVEFKATGLYESSIILSRGVRRNTPARCSMSCTDRARLSPLGISPSQELSWVNVILDPDTAHWDLFLSDDGKGDTQQDIPDIPERFNPCCCMLGCDSTTFRETLLGGAARERQMGSGAVGSYFLALTSPDHTLLPEISTPKQVWICLDYEEGWVAFFSVDEGISIFTFPLVLPERKKINFWFYLSPGTSQNMTVMNGRESMAVLVPTPASNTNPGDEFTCDLLISHTVT
ncbi:Butyrophilin subfamily 2 member A1 [Lamprotornis superbus]|uniref:Butyrophilin subfamily 2 member A1 n=1 Tax=Lamprotornis superbus TaxID=245042 RepID=A0A835NM05_9PASS|nr:Butyrophilin subfamily 2 member A1 [Lamprotornis superbus]